jgi:hypothetical protein
VAKLLWLWLSPTLLPTCSRLMPSFDTEPWICEFDNYNENDSISLSVESTPSQRSSCERSVPMVLVPSLHCPIQASAGLLVSWANPLSKPAGHEDTDYQQSGY